MKNKKILKKLIALVCATTILGGGMTGFAEDTDATTETLSVAEQLEKEGYTRITPENFGIMQESIGSKSANGNVSYLEKQIYFEADISATNGGSESYVALFNKYFLRIFIHDSKIYVYSPNANTYLGSSSGFKLSNYDAKVGEYFNLKVAIKMTPHSTASKTNVAVKVYVNDYVVFGEKTIATSDDHAKGTYLYVVPASGHTIKIRPAVPEAPRGSACPTELEGYRRITPVNYGIANEVIGNNKDYTRASNVYDKVYFEADIAFDKIGGANTNDIFYMGRWNLNIFINNTNELVIQSAQDEIESTKTISRTKGFTLGEYFNIKIATDVAAGTTTGTKVITLNIWANNEPVAKNISTIVEDAYVTNILHLNSNTRMKPAVLEHCAIKYNEIKLYRKTGKVVAPTAPVGYIFAGWYEDEACTTAYTTEKTSGEAWAKFVDARLLTIKAQITAGTQQDTPETAIRFVTSVDDLKYGEVGFDISTTEKKYGGSDRIVYTKLTASVDGKENGYTPENLFCPAAEYFKAWIITNIPSTSYNTVFTVTAYWITIDGTRVNGTTAQKAVSQAF